MFALARAPAQKKRPETSGSPAGMFTDHLCGCVAVLFNSCGSSVVYGGPDVMVFDVAALTSRGPAR